MADGGTLLFGIYPGGLTTMPGLGHAVGPPDDPGGIEAALTALQPADRPFLVRAYDHFRTGQAAGPGLTPADAAGYICDGRKLDLVLCYRSTDGDMGEWTEFVRRRVREFGPHLALLQVTEEPNNPDPATGGDGGAIGVREAIIAGIVAAKDQARACGHPIRVGFNAAISFNPHDDFWPDVGSRVTPEFLAALDYVGLDFFADVWRPIPPDDLSAAVTGLLTHFRTVNLATGRIPASVPMYIGENGWPIGPERTEARQAQVIETVIRAVANKAHDLNIAGYELFALRDARSADTSLMAQFGILKDDYSPKPAFEVYRRLVAELGAATWPGGWH